MLISIPASLLVIMIAPLLVLVFCLVRVRQERTKNKNLAQEIRRIEDQLIAMSKGAVGLSRRLSANEQAVKAYDLKIDNLAHQISTPANYRWAIEHAAAGKAGEELMGNYGLTQGEANLLTGLNRRHGS